ncbi:MAG TPA: rhodanese-like domain-containing protein [Longimicrobiales bacterium]|nr:rhodanese-like domain-containing protein [Longimicrobiales bacterium]
MLLRRFYDEKLAQASYMIGCQATGEAIVVDPNRDADQYMAAAEEEGMTIRFVTETHIHADYLSGTRELARRTGATMLLSGEGPREWQYGFAEEDGARIVHDGDEVALGNIRIQVLHTPGHTPEHISFQVTDGAATDEPLGILSGDFIFVGDVGRPDLLEKAAGLRDTMEVGARVLYESLERFRGFPGHLQILPGHGAGSACGKALGSVPSSTLGYEHMVNWAFQCSTEDEFVERVLQDQPEPPVYFAQMKRMNRDGPATLGGLPEPTPLADDTLPGILASGGVVVDTRDRGRFAQAHVPGTINIPLNKEFPNWCGWFLPYDRSVHLIVDGPEAAREAARDMALIGLDRCAGYHTAAEALSWWESERGPLERSSVTDWEGAQRAVEEEDAVYLDVRMQTEWNEGHVPGALHIHLGYLRDRADELPRDRPLLLYCRSGNRSGMGMSLLQAAGFRDVRNVEGGLVDRNRLGLPLEAGSPVGS